MNTANVAPHGAVPDEGIITARKLTGAWGHLVAAPKRTPRPIIDRVNAELATIVKSQDVRERFDSFGVFPDYTTPEQMLEIVKSEGPPMSKLLQAAGTKPQ